MKKKRGFAEILCLVCCLLICSCKEQEEVVLEQPSLEAAQEEPTKLEKENTSIWVDVGGAVNHPGVYELKGEARVFEAIEAAGGFSENADTGWLNQASLLSDGEKIQVYTLEETSQMKAQGMGQNQSPETESQAAGGGHTGQTGKVNINMADVNGLQEIPGVGKVRAQAIADYREENGAFQSIEEIQKVPGIKGKTFEKIKDYITTE